MTATAPRIDQPAAAGDTDDGDGFFVFPLSPQQQRFWQADKALPGNPALNGAFRLELTGSVNIQALNGTFNALLERHEILRASFREIDGEPKLLIAERMHLAIAEHDLTGLPESQRETAMDALCTAAARHPFNLATGPLIRVELIRLAADRSVLTLTLHHVVCDGWSISLLVDEFLPLYGAALEPGGDPLPALELQYGDYATWLEDHLKSGKTAEQIAYWKRKLLGYTRLDVPPDLPRLDGHGPVGHGLAAEIIAHDLPPNLVAGLQRFCNVQGSTFFIASLTACTALLRGVTGRSDIAIGSPVAGRNRVEVEKIVGPLLNYVVLRSRTAGDPTLRALETDVRKTVLEAFANQDVPFEHVIASLGGGAKALPDPFYSVSFIAQRSFAGGSSFTFDGAGLHMRTLPSKSQGALYDLFFFLVERESGWRLSLEYRSELFSAERAQGFLTDFVAVLEQMSAAPDTRLSELTLQSRPATDTATATTATTADDGDEPHHLPASYAQERFWLLSRAAPENAAFNMPICLRIAGRLDRAHVETALKLLIARHESLRTTFAEHDGSLWQVIAPAQDFTLQRAPLDPFDGEDPEAALTRLMRGETMRTFDLERGPLLRGLLVQKSETDHLLMITLHHIISDGQSVGTLQSELWTHYAALAEGRTPALPELSIQYADFATYQREWSASPEAVVQLDFWKSKLATPLPVLPFPLDRPPQHRPASKGAIVIRPLPPALVAGLKARAIELHSTMFVITSAAFAALLARSGDARDVLFGCPIANRTAQTQGLLGPFAGPLAIRMDIGADPSLRDLTETARDTIFDALANTTYPFELLLGEIKARSVGGRNPLFQFYFLYQASFLQEQSVAGLTISPVPALGTGTPYELQFALFERTSGVSAQVEYNPDLLDHDTVEKVVDYYVAILEKLLTNPGCTLSQLPEPPRKPGTQLAMPAAHAAHTYVPPATAVERQLAEIWQRLLSLPQVSVRDDFFEIGGQSLLAARLIGEIEKACGVRLDLSILVGERTIEQLARRIASRDQSPATNMFPLQPLGTRRPLFCIHGGGGHLLHYQDFASTVSKDQPVFGISAPELDGGKDAPGVEQLATLYIAQMRAVQPRGPYNICGYSFGGIVAFEMAAQLSDAGETTEMLVILDTANRDYYRHMPPRAWLQYWSTFLTSRGMRYLERVAGGRWRDFFGSMGYFARKHATRIAWRVTQRAYQKAEATLPAAIQSNVLMFDAAAERYVPRPYNGRVLLFRSDARDPEYKHNPSLGWELVARGGVDVVTTPGDHLTMVTKPHVMHLVEQLDAYQRRSA